MNRFLKGVIAAGAGLLLLVGLLPSTGIANAFHREPAHRVKVEELFNRNCARCHGADGRGDTPSGHLFKAPDFTDPDWWKKDAGLKSPRRLRLMVTNGQAGMPAFGKKLTKHEINLLVNRVRSFRKSERKS